MDVDCHSFKGQLPLILQAISHSRFVSFDLELSGIPTKQHNRSRHVIQDEGGQQTLQQRYKETKAAAERFQVLQLGLTCVEEDAERGVYFMRPYNFYLNPVPDRKLKIEREFTYQSGAVDFLLRHNFPMQAPFVRGVPYLSFEDESTARFIAEADWVRETLPDIGIRPDDVENLQLMRTVRQEIAIWRQQTTSEPSFLNIAPTGHGEPGYSGRGLNGYQKRLCHQLIRAEYPDLKSISKSDFIQIIPYNTDREDAQLSKKRQGLENNLVSQIGLRWIIQAMCSNVEAVLPEHDSIDSETTSKIQHPPAKEACSIESMRYIVSRVKETVLVGHNLFLDLIYFYACFFGPLPDQVEDFQVIMGTLFPLIVDTKYVAEIMNKNSPRYGSSLEEINKELSKLSSPSIEIPAEHDKYAFESPFHEAGFDSFLTAKALIRLSANMNGEHKTISVGESKHKEPARQEFTQKQDASSHWQNPLSEGVNNSVEPTVEAFANYLEEHISGTVTRPDSQNIFSPLSLEDTNALPDEERKSPKMDTCLMMPPSDSLFWTKHGNRLRVNGTVEGVCLLNKPRKRSDSADTLSKMQPPGF